MPGDLVAVHMKYHTRHIIMDPKMAPTGVVLSVYASNVYEPSSAEILLNGNKCIVEQRYLTRINDVD